MPQLYRNRQPRYRAQRRRDLKDSGIRPRNRQEIWGVLFRGEIPERIAEQAIPGLARCDGLRWLRVRAAKFALRMGWASEVLLKTEFKRCLQCDRPLIGNEAEQYRKALETTPGDLPCGTRCEQERVSKLWHRWLIA